MDRFMSFADLKAAACDLYFSLTGREYIIDPTVQDPDSLQSRAVILINCGEYAGALELIEQALAIDPEHQASILAKGYVFWGQDRHDEAERLAKRILDKEPECAAAHSLAGRVAAALGRYEEAIEHYEVVSRATPDSADSLLDMAPAYIELGRLEEARICLDRADELSPNNWLVMHFRICLFCEEERFEEAAEMLTPQVATDWRGVCSARYAELLSAMQRRDEGIQLLKRFVKDVNHESDIAWNTLGNLWSGTENHARAIECYEASLKQMPDDLVVIVNMIGSMRNNGNSREALELGQQYLDRQVGDYFWNQMGLTADSLGEYDDAQRYYQLAIDRKPDPDYAGNLVSSLRQAGKEDEALRWGDNWSSHHDPNAYFWNEMGMTASVCEQHDKAEQHYRNALRLKPDPNFAGNLVDSLRKLNRSEEALHWGCNWVPTHEPNAYFWNTLGVAAGNCRESERAREYYRNALELKPDPDYAGNLVSNLREDGQADEALHWGEAWLAKHEPGAHFWNHMGLAADACGQHQRAEQYYRNALDLMPYANFAGNLVSSLRKAEEADEALRWGERWSSNHEPNAYFWNNLAMTADICREYDKAEPYYMNALEMNPDADYAGNLVSSLRTAGRAEEALQWGESWLPGHDPSSHFWNQMAVTADGLGEYDDLRRYYGNYLHLQPDAESASQLVAAFMEAGKSDEALRWGERWVSNHEPSGDFWNTLGQAAEDCLKYDKAKHYYQNALELKADTR